MSALLIYIYRIIHNENQKRSEIEEESWVNTGLFVCLFLVRSDGRRNMSAVLLVQRVVNNRTVLQSHLEFDKIDSYIFIIKVSVHRGQEHTLPVLGST